MKKLAILYLLTFVTVQLCFAQYYSTGEDRASIKWKQIDTEHFQIVFPSYYEKPAQQVANLLTNLFFYYKKDMNTFPQKVSILLHTESAKSNGYVSWAPRRSEFYTTPPNGESAEDWLTHLATHEYRHVVQMDKFAEDFPRLLTFLFGEQIVPALLSYKVPKWLMEGDAVLAETIFSNSGRGRSPEFLQELKAYLLEKKRWFGYDKAALGSYKDHVPNIYKLGYPMVANTRKNYGKTFWQKAFNNAGDFPYPWQSLVANSGIEEKRKTILQKLVRELDSIGKKEAIFGSEKLQIKKHWKYNRSNNPMVMLYNDNMTELQARWRQEQTYFDTTAYKVLTPEKRAYTNYEYPYVRRDGSIVALKTGYEDYAKFVKIENGQEQLIYTPGDIVGRMFLSDSLLFWTEAIPNLRWREVSKSAIYYLNLTTGEKTKLQHSKSLFMPSANSDNSFVVAVAKKSDYTNELVVLDRTTENLVFCHNLGYTQISSPCFVNEKKVAYIFTDEETGIAILDLTTGKQELLVKPTNVCLSNLYCGKGKLFFTSGYEGKNDIYSYHLSTGKIYKLTEAPYGATQPCIDKNKLLYANYTSKGYEIVELSLSEALLQETMPNYWEDDFLLKAIKKQENIKEPKQLPDSVFEIKPYRKAAHLFNFHSRSPFAVSMPMGIYDVGISANSQNLLSTMFANVGYRKKTGYKNGQAYANLQYKGWFPVLSTELSYGKETQRLFAILKRYDSLDTALLERRQNIWKWDTEVKFPFTISRGKYYRNLSASVRLEHSKDVDVRHIYLRGTNKKNSHLQGNKIDIGIDKTHQLLSYGFSFSNMHKKSFRDLYSPFGQYVSFVYKHMPFTGEDIDMYAMKGIFYLPSIFKHHGIAWYGGYEFQSDNSEFLEKEIKMPRGTTSLYAKKTFTSMLTYKFPLAYPDWNLGRTLYIKRVKMGLFYDCSVAKTQNISKSMQSYGTEFTADAHFLHIPVPVDIGVRIGYETQESQLFFNLLFAVNF